MSQVFGVTLTLTLGVILFGCNTSTRAQAGNSGATASAVAANKQTQDSKMEKATFANGCFWCTEAVFERIKGIQSVTSGYIGGVVDNPSYKQISTGRTGHAEAVEIVFDPTVISYEKLLEIFWQSHNPTTLNRQGPDRGTQYRSAVFYHNEDQKQKAEFYKKKLDEAEIFNKPIVTEISPATTFFLAEEYHQDYFAKNPADGYCQFNATPKVRKVEKLFAEYIKGN